MDEEGIENVLLTGGGIIPKEDMQTLSKLGVGKMFGPGTTVDSTIEYIENWVNDNRN
jgi:methylmalonyl-CoA mutase C-terminal domain/subunit